METVWSKAADRIREWGWAKNKMGDSQWGVCLVGAVLAGINAVTVDRFSFMGSDPFSFMERGTYHTVIRPLMVAARRPEMGPVWQKILEAVGVDSLHASTISVGTGGPVLAKFNLVELWNDDHGRTREEVLELLDGLHEKELAERGEMV